MGYYGLASNQTTRQNQSRRLLSIVAVTGFSRLGLIT